MNSDLSTVFDTNVLVSALLLRRSVPRQALDLALSIGRALTSSAALTELNDVLRHSKFDPYVSQAERLEFLAEYLNQAELVEVTESMAECRDPKDNKFLELAVTGKASFLVTGDPDLLVMNPFRGVPIVTPVRFLSSR